MFHSHLILLNAVAYIVELCESGGNFVHEFTERMQEQIVGNLDDHFRESKKNFG